MTGILGGAKGVANLLLGLVIAYACLALALPGLRTIRFVEMQVGVLLVLAVIIGMPVLGLVLTGLSIAAFAQLRIGLFAAMAFISFAALVVFWVNISSNWIWLYAAY
jgi:hypothetical protein